MGNTKDISLDSKIDTIIADYSDHSNNDAGHHNQIYTRQLILVLISSEIKKARFDELTKLGRLYNGSRKNWCDYYENRYKFLEVNVEANSMAQQSNGGK